MDLEPVGIVPPDVDGQLGRDPVIARIEALLDEDRDFYESKDLVRPYRVGVSCAFCHVGPNPTTSCLCLRAAFNKSTSLGPVCVPDCCWASALATFSMASDSSPMPSVKVIDVASVVMPRSA